MNNLVDFYLFMILCNTFVIVIVNPTMYLICNEMVVNQTM